MSLIDQQRERLQDDLRGLIAGEVFCDDVHRQLYASDASIYEIKPLGVVRPRSAADVAALVRYAAEKGISLHARGAGSGIAGEALGAGLVVDFSVHFRRVIRLEENRLRLQPGVIHQRLNQYLRPLERMFPPDPDRSATTTIGGMIAVDAVGARGLKYGSTRRYVRSLQVVLADGEVLELGRESLREAESANLRKRELTARLSALFKEHEELIQRFRPPCLTDHCGYNLEGIFGEDYLDLARLLVGSEGTLGLVTEATLEFLPLPPGRGVALLLFDSLEKAARTVTDVLTSQPVACELLDRRHISLVREADARLVHHIPLETETVLLVELEGEGPVDVRQRLHALVNAVWQRNRLAFAAREALEPREMELYWRVVQAARPAFTRLTGIVRPVAAVEAMAVPVEALADFLVRVQNVLKRNQATAAVRFSAGQGQVQLLPFLNLDDAADVQRLRRMAEELYEEVWAFRGSICSGGACGLSRSGFVARQAGPLLEVFREIKRLFDPQNILNPGKILSDDPELLTRCLRPSLRASGAGMSSTGEPAPTEPTGTDAPAEPASTPRLRKVVELQLDWQPGRLSDIAAACNRCGDCRTQSAEQRMCPFFRCFLTEEASPRAKVNLLRGVLTDELDLSALTSEECKAVADLCVHCHSCRLECAAGADVPRLMCETKAAYVAAHGLTAAERAIIRLDLPAALGGMFAPLVNRLLANRQMRWLLEKTLGIHQGRKLPRLAGGSFLHRAARHRLDRPLRHGGQKVLYFLDVFANYFDHQLAEATIAVLEHNGFSVYVPTEQKQAGMAAIACGALEHARRLAVQNVRLLAEAVRLGYTIVATEPAAVMCLRHEYPWLLDDDDARLVAAHSTDVCNFLWDMHTRGQMQLDLKPLGMSFGYHQSCHQRALQGGMPGPALLNLIPGLQVKELEGGCCGLAGTYGLLRKNYRNSLRAGRKLILQLRNAEVQAGATECSACKLQMEQTSSKPVLHPLKLLAYSYGLLPKLEELKSLQQGFVRSS